MKTSFLSLLAGLLLGTSSANADIVMFETGATTVDGNPVNAKVTFTTSLGEILIKLENLQANPKDVAQIIYGLMFQLSNNVTSASLTSIDGTYRNVNANGSFSDGDPASTTEWSVSASAANTLYLNTLDSSGPDTGIIGAPNSNGLYYTDANGSIAGNNSHNPFIGLAATFLLSVAGVTEATKVNSATFFFGTTPGAVSFTDGHGVVPQATGVPEVSSILAWGSIATIVGLARFSRRRIVA